jgi:hypothetical protein
MFENQGLTDLSGDAAGRKGSGGLVMNPQFSIRKVVPADVSG